MSDQIIFYFSLSQPVSSDHSFHIRSSDRIHRMQMYFIIQSLFRQPVKQLYPITAIFRIIPQIMVAVDQFDLTLCTFYESDCLIHTAAPDISPRCRTQIVQPDFHMVSLSLLLLIFIKTGNLVPKIPKPLLEHLQSFIFTLIPI